MPMKIVNISLAIVVALVAAVPVLAVKRTVANGSHHQGPQGTFTPKSLG
jgi:hypothetical protein